MNKRLFQIEDSKNRENWDFNVVKTWIQDCFKSSKIKCKTVFYWRLYGIHLKILVELFFKFFNLRSILNLNHAWSKKSESQIYSKLEIFLLHIIFNWILPSVPSLKWSFYNFDYFIFFGETHDNVWKLMMTNEKRWK